MKKLTPKPFLKWVGGKRSLLKQLDTNLPEFVKKNEPFIYIEPFLGGGAMFFHLLNNYNIKEVFLNDININLINTYQEIKNNVNDLITELKCLEENYSKINSKEKKKIYYLEKRKLFNVSKNILKKSALLIFLNKTCFNGMYRENSLGKFNVPFGDMKNPKICDKDLLILLNKTFNNATFSSTSFNKKFIKKSNYPIFYYLDPPYRPISDTSSFKDYSSKNNFNDKMQKKLFKFCEKINKNNCFFMQSNSYSNNGFFQDLYKNFNQKELLAPRMIEASGNNREKIKELIIYNYE